MIIADASLAFVGNIDHSIPQIVNSPDHDLFLSLPKEFDLAIMDRFACYLPGWEMPKNSSEFLTQRFGFITDYVAEAFHYQLKQTNRYEEVAQRIRLGSCIEGRDEKGINKTVAAFLKILHPDGPPTDEEFDEYTAYAVECRRRVKEQMNKRKPDDEFANIGLSFIDRTDKEVIVFCPESKDATATVNPVKDSGELTAAEPQNTAPAATTTTPAKPVVDALQEKHFKIHYGETGHSYESIIGPYMAGASEIVIEDAYIRAVHQVVNFVRLCEVVVKLSNIKTIRLITIFAEPEKREEVGEKLQELKQSLVELDVELEIRLNPKLHDREIRMDNGWTIKIGRGLDFYQRPDNWNSIGVNDLSLRKCMETSIDIFRSE